MQTRQEAIQYCHSFQDVYEDYPFHSVTKIIDKEFLFLFFALFIIIWFRLNIFHLLIKCVYLVIYLVY